MNKLIICIISLLSIISAGCTQTGDKISEKTVQQKVRIGVYKGEASSLFYAAEKMGFFEENGIEAELIDYPTGRDAVTDMLDNDAADMAVSTEFVVLRNNDPYRGFRIIASISQADINSTAAKVSSGVFAKKSSGINTPQDLRGKNIAATINAITDFLCGIFLEQNGMSYTDANVIAIKPEDRTKFLDMPEYDAFFVWEPKLYKQYSSHPDKLNYFQIPSVLPFHFVLSAKDEFRQANPGADAKVLRALEKAEQWLQDNPDELKKLIMEKVNLTGTYAENSLKRHHMLLNLPYTLPKAMEMQMDWLRRYKSFDKNNELNVYRLIDSAPLREVNSESVTIIE